MSKVIDYYMSHSSPWTYLGHERFAAVAKAAGAQVQLKPADYGKVFAASGGIPLKQRPLQRQAYRMAELKRWREHLKLPLTLEPAYFPFDATLASLMTIAAQAQGGANGGEAAGMRFTSAVLQGCWVEEKNMADADALVATGDALGMNGAALLDLARQPAAAATYQRNSEQAVEAQVFGAPTYIYRGELFWGQDRLDFLERALLD